MGRVQSNRSDGFGDGVKLLSNRNPDGENWNERVGQAKKSTITPDVARAIKIVA